MSVLKAMLEGLRRAAGSPLILLWLWLLNFVVALPATWVVQNSLKAGIGASRAHETLMTGFDLEWYNEYRDGARGVEASFTPTHSGAGAVYDNLEGWLTGEIFARHPVLVAVGVAYGLIWILMLGGVLDRYADRESPPGIRRFFASAGQYFFRFFRLAALSGVIYFLVFLLSRWLFDKLDDATRDVTVEGTVMFYSLLAWALVAFLLTLVHMSFGYAKIATVVENRRSMLLAALRGLLFVVTRSTRTLPLYYGILIVSALLLGLYSLIAPGVGQPTGEAVFWAFLASQLFLLLKLLVRLSLLAGQTALYQGETKPPEPDVSI